jgi:hypothetical protein
MGIKNFMGKRQEISKNTPQKFQVKDFMTRKLITFSPNRGYGNTAQAKNYGWSSCR